MQTKSNSTRRMRASSFVLVLAAVCAVAAMAAASASALSITESPLKFTSSGAGLTVQSPPGSGWKCTSSDSEINSSSFSTGTAGEMQLRFKGCTMNGGPCTSSGQAAGTFLSAKLSIKLVYLDAAHTKFGLLLTPVTGTTFAQCTVFGVPLTWTGSVIGQIVSPGLNTATEKFTLAFQSSTPGHQLYQQVEGAGALHHLTQKVGFGGVEESISLETQTTQVLSKVAKFLP